MHGHDTALAALANEDSRHWMIDGARGMNATGETPSRDNSIPRVSVENRRGVKPAAAGRIEEPSSIVIRSPAPRLKANPGVAERGIHGPLAIRERRPTEAHTERSPTKSIGPAVGKGAIGIEIGESRSVIGRTSVLQRCSCGGGKNFDAAGDPAGGVVFLGEAADAAGRNIRR